MNTKSPLVRPLQDHGRQGVRDSMNRDAIARGFVVQGSLSQGPMYTQPVYTPQAQGSARDPLTGNPRPQGGAVSAYQMQEQARQMQKAGFPGSPGPAPAPVSGAPTGPSAAPGAAPGSKPAPPGPPATHQATGAPKAPSVPTAPMPHTQAPPAGQPAGFRTGQAMGQPKPPTATPQPATHQPQTTPGHPSHVPPPMAHPATPPPGPVVKTATPRPAFAPLNARVVGKSRTYIHSAAAAPPGAAVKTGEHGGMYYEDGGGSAGGKTEVTPSPFAQGPAGAESAESGSGEASNAWASYPESESPFAKPAEELTAEDLAVDDPAPAPGGDFLDPAIDLDRAPVADPGVDLTRTPVEDPGVSFSPPPVAPVMEGGYAPSATGAAGQLVAPPTSESEDPAMAGGGKTQPVDPGAFDPSKYQVGIGDAARGAYQYGQGWGAAIADPGGGAFLTQVKQTPEKAAAALSQARARAQMLHQAEAAHSKELEQYQQSIGQTAAKGGFVTRVA